MDWRDAIKGKKITVMGLDLEGRGLQGARFLAEHGAEVIATDLKKESDLKASLEKLAHLKNITYVLGEHRLEDFQNKDLILRAASAPIGSPYLKEAQKNNIPIETDETLFLRLAPALVTIGVTGTRGKTTTTSLIYEMVKHHFVPQGRGVFLGGNVRGLATLPLLEKVKANDIVVMELSSWHLQSFGVNKISPHIAVFTNLMNDHLNYYGGSMDLYFQDKAKIFLNQKPSDYLVVGPEISKRILGAYGSELPVQPRIIGPETMPVDWKLKLPGEHNRANITLALEVGKILGIPEAELKLTVENFTGVAGRLEYVREVSGVKIYNDTTATTPDATIAGLKALSNSTSNAGPSAKNVVLIFGGADKMIDMSALFVAIPQYVKAAILLLSPGKTTGSTRIEPEFDKLSGSGVILKKADSLVAAVAEAQSLAQSGDIILFSPGFASFGMFKNEYDRGDQFNDIIKKL